LPAGAMACERGAFGPDHVFEIGCDLSRVFARPALTAISFYRLVDSTLG
jgi:hypothetical protein